MMDSEHKELFEELDRFMSYLMGRADDGVCPHCLILAIQNIELHEVGGDGETDHWGDPKEMVH